jgi:hypothetical protein
MRLLREFGKKRGWGARIGANVTELTIGLAAINVKTTLV